MGEGEGEKSSDCVKVAVRCRPPSQKELSNNEQSIVDMQDSFGEGETGQVILTDPSGNDEPAKFAFDIVFGLSVLQSQIYETIGRPALQKTFEGYNGTIFAYGQTGSGKSFTMSGAPPPELRGIIPRVNDELFQRITEEQVGSRRFLVMCSFFEIYNEIIFDLLNPVADRGKLGGGLQIKEHPVMGIYVKDLTEIVAEDALRLEKLLEDGSKSRAVSSTLMNSTSSRSHSIFIIKVHQKDEEDTSRNVFAKLNLVDLAGSERQKGTGATGQTLKEGANINKSLSALGNVINALVECASGKKVFIPYRNSKLTRVLQESLGGNSLCTMLATLSPAACNYEETMSTLRYANRAKAIKVSATKNEEASQVSRLKAEVEELKKKLTSAGGNGGLSPQERDAEKLKFERQLKDMETMMNSNWGDKAKLSEEHQRKMELLDEERKRAAQALEEERSKRLRLLQEKKDLELSIRGFIDLVTFMPKFTTALPLGEQPRQWLKAYRSLRLQLEEIQEQKMMVRVFQEAFDEAVKLWGAGVEAEDLNLAFTGLTRCFPKLQKLRKAGEKLLQVEGDGLSTAADLFEVVRQSMAELEKFREKIAAEQEEAIVVEASASASAATADAVEGRAAAAAALEELSRMLSLVQGQVQDKLEELQQLAAVEMGSTCQRVLLYSQNCLGEASPLEDEAVGFVTLKALIANPSLASLPRGMPSKPLREYEATDTQDSPETTEALLGLLIRWEGLCGGKTRKSASELLTRPPPKFILDVAGAVKAQTGFPAQLEVDWPESRDERIARLRCISEAVAATLGVQIDFDPTDVLKGKEVAKTLRLMQLLAVAAAKSREVEANPGPALARPQCLPTIMDSIDRCLQAAKQHVERRRKSAASEKEGAEQSLEASLEAQIAELERQLQEESRDRLRREEGLADAERQLEEQRAEMKQISNQCELTLSTGLGGVDQEQQELTEEVEDLRKACSEAGAMSPEELRRMLASRAEGLRAQILRGEEEIRELQQKSTELGNQKAETANQARRLEADLLREKQRKEQEEELIGQSAEEQKLILQAQEKKLRLRVAALEAQISATQSEAEARKDANDSLQDERNDLSAKAEDAALQMQIVQEERDAMREAMEQLWNQKAAVDEELRDVMDGYTNLTERFSYQQDETLEIEALVEQRQQEVAILQRNGFHMLSVQAAAG